MLRVGAGADVRSPRAELLVALLAEAALLTAFSSTVGLGLVGWLTGAVVAVTGVLLVRRGLVRSGAVTLGWANAVTMTRAILGCGIAAVVMESWSRAQSGPLIMSTALAAGALALDAVDGQVARRTRTATAVGARFDQEADAFLLLVLSVLVARTFGPWVLAIGALRYVFVAAGWLWPWLRRPLEPRFSRKVVAALQGVALVAVVPGVLPPLVARGLVAGALGCLLWSFGRDVWWLARRRDEPPADLAAGCDSCRRREGLPRRERGSASGHE